MPRLGRTEPFRDARGGVRSGSIAEIARVKLGGLEQWTMIRGADVGNPLLVMLHGGPGMPETRLWRHFNSALEEAFTVVYWEQRGAGKSFSPRTPKETMTIGRFVSDLDELVDYARHKLGKEKAVIFGHSWGSALGTLYAARFPQKVLAYVGTGQIGNLQQSEEASLAFVFAEAERRGDRKAIAALTAIGKPPHGAKQLQVQRRHLMRYAGLFRNISFLRALRILTGGPEGSLFDLVPTFRGMMFSLDTMWDELAKVDLETAAPELKVPVHFFLGRHDHQVDAVTAERYFAKLVAPSKALVWFEDSAHSPPFEEPAKFNALMTELRAALR
jgi:pimeloyl-ACP methyl ester carboxylesterase